MLAFDVVALIYREEEPSDNGSDGGEKVPGRRTSWMGMRVESA